MPVIGISVWVLAFITSRITLAGLFAGLQPKRMLSSGPTLAPFGPQLFVNLTTPVLVPGSNAPWTTLTTVPWNESSIASGSVTRTPPLQVIGPGDRPALQPGGLSAMIGIEV